MENIAANCNATPSAPLTARVGENVRLSGRHTYSVSNPGGASINVRIEARIEDSEGSGMTDSKPVTVRPGTTESGTMDTFFVKGYSQPGNIMVTARTNISGDAFCSTSGGQRMEIVRSDSDEEKINCS